MIFNVYQISRIGDRDFGTYVRSVEAETASDAEALVCRLKWIARTSLKAYSDADDPWRTGWPTWAPMMLETESRMGRPSQGRSVRLQAAITPDQLAWLESQKQSGESTSDVVFRLLNTWKVQAPTSFPAR